jgi:hypothetical protein
MTAHRELEELAAYAAGDLDAADVAAVEDHVARCADCAADLAAIRGVADDLAAVPELTMPADVAAALDEAVAAARAESARSGVGSSVVVPMRASRRSAMRAKLAGLAAGSAAAALIGVVAVSALSDRAKDNSGATASDSGNRSGAEALARREFSVRRTGTNYTADTIEAEAKELLAAQDSADAETDTDTGVAAPAAPTAASGKSEQSFGSGTDPDVAARAVDSDQLTRCVDLLVEQAQSERPLVVDLASYEGIPAIVVVLPLDDRRVEVWFLDATQCGTEAAGEDIALLVQRQVSL